VVVSVITDVPIIRRIIRLVISTAFFSPTSLIVKNPNEKMVIPGVKNRLNKPAIISSTTMDLRPFTINENGTWLSLIMPIIDNKTIANNTALSAENNVMIKTRVENSFTLGSNE
jgi:hypothetical protein